MGEPRWRVQVRNKRGTVCCESTFRHEPLARASFATLDFPEIQPGVFDGWTKRLEVREAGASRFTLVEELALPVKDYVVVKAASR